MIVGRVAPILALLAAACGDNGATALPDPPASLERPREYAWGDAVAARDNRMATHVADALGARFGKAREEHYVASPEPLVALRADYARRLGTGWRPLALAWSPGEGGFGFENGRRALVVAWLDAQPDGRVPVTVFRFGVR